MVNKKGILILTSFLLAYGTDAAMASESGTYQQAQQTKILGKQSGASLNAGVQPGTQKVQTTAGVQILGILFQALQAYLSPPNTYGGVTYTEVYSFGKRVFSQNGSYTAGVNQISAGLPPIEIRVPFIIYPIGPLFLQIDGGVRFKANVSAQITPNIGIPVSLSTLGLQLTAAAGGAGFIEGYGKLLIIRAGVGGQLDLIDAQADVNARVAFDGSPAIATVDAMVEFLRGRFYAFVDYFSVFRFGWKRLWDHDLYSWNGFCYATGTLACPRS